jgi:hypothetical protein
MPPELTALVKDLSTPASILAVGGVIYLMLKRIDDSLRTLSEAINNLATSTKVELQDAKTEMVKSAEARDRTTATAHNDQSSKLERLIGVDNQLIFALTQIVKSPEQIEKLGTIAEGLNQKRRTTSDG